MRAGARAGEGRRGGGRRGSSVPLRGCARTWPFGGDGCPSPSLAPSVGRLADRAPAQTVFPSGMAEPTPRTAPWDRAGLPAPRHPQERGGGAGGEGAGGSARAARGPRDQGPGYSSGPAMSAPAPPPGRGNGGGRVVCPTTAPSGAGFGGVLGRQTPPSAAAWAEGSGQS